MIYTYIYIHIYIYILYIYIHIFIYIYISIYTRIRPLENSCYRSLLGVLIFSRVLIKLNFFYFLKKSKKKKVFLGFLGY